ncbi:MAG: glutamine--fructose-6-phosphate transaminase (isomerizing) [Clostridia bacterium]|nr:glutamine--fructose-6-phosphate transaminase (isomerizing) [Clostridia bacterium]
MCGIVGFAGNSPAVEVLLDGLSKLEYRGYDSAGIAVMDGNEIKMRKMKGRIADLTKKLESDPVAPAPIGIGHTRWATHGKPNDVNSHPHMSGDGRFAVVHNGIIENYASIKEDLIAQGVQFASETDTEVIAHLLEKNYTGDILETVRNTARQLEGSYALGVLCTEHPDRIIAVRKASPLIVGLGEGENFIASDIPAVLSRTRKIHHLNDNELVELTKDGVRIFSEELQPIEKPVETVTWDVRAAEKDGWPHFMIKEIMEQPTALHDTISPRIADGEIVLDGLSLTKKDLEETSRIYIVACGSAYHVGIVAKYFIEKVARVPVEVDLASEFRYRAPMVDDKTLVIIISQSGETADTLAALKEAKSMGGRILSIVNVVGSSIANESDDVLYTWAGPEIAVATTKAYSTQLAMMYLIGTYIAKTLGRIDDATYRALLADIRKLPEQVKEVIEKNNDFIKKLAEQFSYIEHAYYIGRNLDYAVAMEASLKLKEVSYVHSEAYAAGELKHGTISLIEEGTLVVALASHMPLLEKTISNIKEVKSRGAIVLTIAQEGATAVEDCSDYILNIPATHELLAPSLQVVPMQMLGYYMAIARGCDVDKPRNLAKSVTVE